MRNEKKVEPLLHAQNVCLNFGEKVMLSNISLKISFGEIVTIIGPNGAGKSTLLKVMLGLIPPNSGKIFRKNNLSIGYLPQKINYDQILPLSVSRIMKLTGIYKEKYIF